MGKFRYYEGYHGDDRYGRCDRESQCGFHEKPPLNEKPVQRQVKYRKQIFPQEPVTMRFDSVFHQYLTQFGFTEEDFRREGVFGDDQGRTRFIFRNEAGRIVNIKTMGYEIIDGQLKRKKDSNAYSLSAKNEGEYYGMCLGGEHLLDPQKKRIVCVVESEKSRIVARKFYPEFDWVDCQSANGLSDGSNGTSDKITPLKGRTVYWVCDADGGSEQQNEKGEIKLTHGGRVNSSIQNLNKHGITWEMVDLFPNRDDGWDICDELFFGGRPEIKPTGIIIKKQPQDAPAPKPEVIPMRDHFVRAELVVERIEEARIDITDGMQDNLQRIAASLSIFREKGRTLLHRVARFAPTYEADIQFVDEAFDEAAKSGKKKFTKWFFDIANDYGIDVSKPAQKEETKKNDLDLVPLDVQDEYLKFGFYEYKGSYYTIRQNSHMEVSNFVMKILYHVQTSDQSSYRLIEIKNRYGKTDVIQLNTDDFTTVGTFRKAIERKGNYLFKGTDTDLFRLKDKLQRDEADTTMVDSLGYHKKNKYWFWANGLYDTNQQNEEERFHPVDENGIVVYDGKNYFIPAMAKLFADRENLFVNDKKFLYLKSEITFSEWANKYFQVYGDRGMMGMMFYVTCLYRDIVYDAMNRRFPILNLYGKKGSGKGTFAQSIMRLFGHEQDQYMLGGGGTVKGFMRKFAQFRNAIVWLDEYKNNLNKFFIESLKNIYDGIGYERAKMDNTFQTDTMPVHSGCLLSGQEMPTIEPALFTRVILITFEDTNRSDETKKLFQELTRMEAKGLSHISSSFLQHRAIFEKEYREEFILTKKEVFNAVSIPEIDDRMVDNIAAIITITKIITSHNLVTLPFSYMRFRDYAIENLKKQYDILVSSDDVSKFWDIVDHLFNTNQINNPNDFILQDGFIFIRVQQIYPLYAKEMSAMKDPNVLSKETLDNYLRTDKRFVQHLKKKFGRKYGWCMMFQYAPLNINLIYENDEGLLERKLEEMGVKQSPQLSSAGQASSKSSTGNAPF